MRRVVILRALAGVAVVLVLVAAFAVAPQGSAAHQRAASCNIATDKCIGLDWGGHTKQPGALPRCVDDTCGAIGFLTNLSKTLMTKVSFDVVRVTCSALPGTVLPVAGGTVHVYPIIRGRISITGTNISPVATHAKLPGLSWQMKGTLTGNRASGIVKWSLAGPNKQGCTPSNGSFSWHVINQGKVDNV